MSGLCRHACNVSVGYQKGGSIRRAWGQQGPTSPHALYLQEETYLVKGNVVLAILYRPKPVAVHWASLQQDSWC